MIRGEFKALNVYIMQKRKVDNWCSKIYFKKLEKEPPNEPKETKKEENTQDKNRLWKTIKTKQK